MDKEEFKIELEDKEFNLVMYSLKDIIEKALTNINSNIVLYDKYGRKIKRNVIDE